MRIADGGRLPRRTLATSIGGWTSGIVRARMSARPTALMGMGDRRPTAGLRSHQAPQSGASAAAAQRQREPSCKCGGPLLRSIGACSCSGCAGVAVATRGIPGGASARSSRGFPGGQSAASRSLYWEQFGIVRPWAGPAKRDTTPHQHRGWFRKQSLAEHADRISQSPQGRGEWVPSWDSPDEIASLRGGVLHEPSARWEVVTDFMRPVTSAVLRRQASRGHDGKPDLPLGPRSSTVLYGLLGAPARMDWVISVDEGYSCGDVDCTGATPEYCVRNGKDFINVGHQRYVDRPMAFSPNVDYTIAVPGTTAAGSGSGVYVDRRVVLGCAHVFIGNNGQQSFNVTQSTVNTGTQAPTWHTSTLTHAFVAGQVYDSNRPKYDWSIAKLRSTLPSAEYMEYSSASNSDIRNYSPSLFSYSNIRRNTRCNIGAGRMQTRARFDGWNFVGNKMLRYDISSSTGSSGGALAANPDSTTNGTRSVVGVHKGVSWSLWNGRYKRGVKTRYWYSAWVALTDSWSS